MQCTCGSEMQFLATSLVKDPNNEIVAVRWFVCPDCKLKECRII